MKSVHTKLKTFVETAFLEVLVHVMETVEEKEYAEKQSHPKCLIAINTVLQLNGIVEKRLNGLKKELAKLFMK